MGQLGRAARSGRLRTLHLLVVSLSFVPAVTADVLTGSLHIVASNAAGTAVLDIPVSAGTIDANGAWRWSRSTSLPLLAGGSDLTVATLLNADITIRTAATAEVLANLSFLSGTSSTTFVIETPRTTFRRVPALVATGRATASFTVTDTNANDAQLIALGPLGSGAYHGYFNGGALNGLQFSQLVAIVFAGRQGTATGTQNDPPFGYRAVGSFVDNAQLQLSFIVTPGDRASMVTRLGFPDASTRCAGDVDADGDVDVEDLSKVLAAYGESVGSSAYNINADFDNDGLVSLDDLSTLLFYYGSACVSIPG